LWALFEASLKLHEQARATGFLSPAVSEKAAVHSIALCERLLATPPHIRGRYALLLVLTRQCGVGQLLAAGSRHGQLEGGTPFVPSMLAAVQDLAVRKPAADLVVGAARLHLEELQGSVLKPLAAESEAPATTTSPALQQWQEAWLRPLICALCNAAVFQFRNLMEACVPRLLALHAGSIAYCLASLDCSKAAHIRVFVGLLQLSRTAAALRNCPEVPKDSMTVGTLQVG